MSQQPFSLGEARALWARMVVGWAQHLDASGARSLLDGIANSEDAGGSYEGVTRMLWGLGGWLSQEREIALNWRGNSVQPDVLIREALIAGTNPASLGYWGQKAKQAEYDQRTVESAQVAFATWQSRQHSWNLMTDQQQDNLIDWLDTFGQQPSVWHNNWALFWLLNHASRKALGVRFDQALIDSVLDYLDTVYCADGWYDDGQQRGVNHFDDYNYWVFATHVLAWAQLDGDSQPERRELLFARIREGMVHFPYFFAADGAYCEYGRSLSYKFARLAAPLWAYKAGLWPHPVGMLRRLVGRHLRWYISRGALRADGTLRQSLTAEGSLAVREPYIATGSTYWAMLAFAGLWSLSDGDPFWHEAEVPLPVEQGDFCKALRVPGWLLVGQQASGEVQRFNARSEKYPAKYGKYLYATAAPFNVGQADGNFSPDNMLCLTNGEAYAHRHGNLASAVGEPGWLRMRYEQQLEGQSHLIDTTIISRGYWHLRAHQVTLTEPLVASLAAIEGPSPLGFSPGAQPRIQSAASRGWEKASVTDRAAVAARHVGIMRLRGYDRQQRAAAWQGRHDLNSVHADYVLPLIGVSELKPQHALICLVAVSHEDVDFDALAATIISADWLEDGSFYLLLQDGTEITVPDLKR